MSDTLYIQTDKNMKVTKEKRWRILFILLLFMSVLALTYNFEKSTIIYYFIFYS